MAWFKLALAYLQLKRGTADRQQVPGSARRQGLKRKYPAGTFFGSITLGAKTTGRVQIRHIHGTVALGGTPAR
ncbi:hypothetical protein BKA56DRAFT_582786 [Ilyonectria sp. MPI-CAGE-AT-0026]|nr:hypothetical protein BKA56DRAFT_582786 [Ilyonectria sp. MPI-CAGE-AT-0026]